MTQQDSGDRAAETDPRPTAGAAGVPAPWARLALDLFERAFVIALFAWLTWSVVAAVGRGATWVNLLQLGAEGLNVVFIVLRRRALATSYRPADWAVALGAVSFSMAVRPGALPPLASPAIAAALILAGFGLQIWSKLTLRRSFGITPANRGLVVRGPYRYVRHPMYLGYLLGWIGFYMLNPTLWNTNVYALCALLQWLRIEAEERVLAEDPAFAAYRAEVRYRVVPGVY
ncbi:MAG TPA: isoprenylcysteine carboxylmethyltransferase family protein [Caulobacteraceae bacterium]|nr:isoprenylcysteine carboxylmethyltransferase family protein [Caulobacteraceae bacterium]